MRDPLPLLFICIIMFACAGHTPADGAEPVDPLVLAFYSPSYGTPTGPGGTAHGEQFIHWSGVDADTRSIASARHSPMNGPYDSHDPEVIAGHCALAKEVGLDGFLLSWRGQGTYEDEAVPLILKACAADGLAACLSYEQIPEGASPADVAAEILCLMAGYGERPGYLRIERGGTRRPVLFIDALAIEQLGLEAWRKVAASLTPGQNLDDEENDGEKDMPGTGPRPVLIGDAFGSEAFEIFDGAYISAPMADLHESIEQFKGVNPWIAKVMPRWAEQPREMGRISTVTVFPGYDDTGIRDPGMEIRRDGGRLYQKMWRRAVEAGPDWVLIASFNAWNEGTEIEPSDDNGRRELITTKRWTAEFKKARAAE